MAAGKTYDQLFTTTLTTAVTSLTISSISGAYTDLRLVIVADDGGTQSYVAIRLNGDSASNYSRTTLYGDGTSAGSYRGNNETYIYCTGLDDSFRGNIEADFMNYSNATTYKTVLMRGNNTTTTRAKVALWRATPAAITSIAIYAGSSNFAVGSSFTLYGIAAA
jgi:hypothetical protein